MVETKNPAIKLFGKRIRVSPWPDGVSPSHPAVDSAEEEAELEDYGETEQDHSEEQGILKERKDDGQSFREEEPSSPEASPDSVNPKTPSIDEETSKTKTSKNGKDPKSKPDKILPCPRCNSSETKFCYYNNYNVNQPRHFCKSCQRYWTAGGTMRNVPVGAGRRKSKSSSCDRHVSISEALQTAARVVNLTPDGTVLSFGLNQCDSAPSPVQKRAGTLNGSGSHDGSTGNFSDEHPTSNLNGIGPQVHCLSSVPWPYSVPIPFYPPPPPPQASAFWACSNVSIPFPWSFPLLPPPSLISGPNPLILGKHPREGDAIKSDKPTKNGSILIPKTLRIDDPTEAAKSSIWATLGIKNEFGTKGGFFKGFQPKGKENEVDQTAWSETEKFRVLRANPAALSRSLNFHENT